MAIGCSKGPARAMWRLGAPGRKKNNSGDLETDLECAGPEPSPRGPVIVMAYIVMAYLVMAYLVMACAVLEPSPHGPVIVMAHIVMAYLDMADIGMGLCTRGRS